MAEQAGGRGCGSEWPEEGENSVDGQLYLYYCHAFRWPQCWMLITKLLPFPDRYTATAWKRELKEIIRNKGFSMKLLGSVIRHILSVLPTLNLLPH